MENNKCIPAVCIVGRPNVGKSSLFNCLLEERRAVVVSQAGTTRDRNEATLALNGGKIKLVDTGGYLSGDKDELSQSIKKQIYQAMEEASVLLLVTDAVEGVSPYDKEVALLLRKFSKPVILIANKVDNQKRENDALEFYQLGFGRPEMISCVHRKGIRGVRARLKKLVGDIALTSAEGPSSGLKIAVVGRPNVGKSSFINSLMARERVIVSDTPGTTRDSVDTIFNCEGNDYILIDTAGIRHKRKVKNPVDAYSVMRSADSIRRADVAVLLLDAAEGVTKDDIGILSLIEESGKACLVVVNKWDLAQEVGGVSAEDYKKHLLYASSWLGKFPISFISAKTGKGVMETLSVIRVLNANLDLDVSTPFLNRIFEKKDPSRVPIPRSKKRPNFLYITQSGQRPVEFKFFVSDPTSVRPAHLNFIENQLRSNLPLLGIPIKINMRRSKKKKV
ncbi:MAG: ribosome biogenesis GTPase Der [Candidatus Omnitrophota bacterium]